MNKATRFFSKILQGVANALFDYVAILEKPTKEQVERLAEIVTALSELASPASDGDTFSYTEIIRLISLFVVESGLPRLYVIIDEWAQIPIYAQPFVAEFVKRAFFPNKLVTFKVGVVDYAYQLSETIGGSVIGLEKSADIFSDIRMDSHFVWDENTKFVEEFFAELLFNHLALAIGLPLDVEKFRKIQSIKTNVFTQEKTFSELCRASEGNARDFIVIFGRAHSDFLRQQSREKVGLSDVQKAASAWYRDDKLNSIAKETQLTDFMRFLVEDVISKRRSRTFMVQYQELDHVVLRRLFAARILHPLNTEWSHPDKPGERYRLITIDYGAYASFKGTGNEPQEYVFWEPNSPARPVDLVPIDDRRSIRRIVVTNEMLDRFKLH